MRVLLGMGVLLGLRVLRGMGVLLGMRVLQGMRVLALPDLQRLHLGVRASQAEPLPR
jgi:hypothetical protein